jgi:hypothetical protein
MFASGIYTFNAITLKQNDVTVTPDVGAISLRRKRDGFSVALIGDLPAMAASVNFHATFPRYPKSGFTRCSAFQGPNAP